MYTQPPGSARDVWLVRHCFATRRAFRRTGARSNVETLSGSARASNARWIHISGGNSDCAAGGTSDAGCGYGGKAAEAAVIVLSA